MPQVRARLSPVNLPNVLFWNGRIDLVQAEAVMDIIKSRSDAALKVAVRQQEGQLSSEVRGLRKELLDVIVNLGSGY